MIRYRFLIQAARQMLRYERCMHDIRPLDPKRPHVITTVSSEFLSDLAHLLGIEFKTAAVTKNSLAWPHGALSLSDPASTGDISVRESSILGFGKYTIQRARAGMLCVPASVEPILVYQKNFKSTVDAITGRTLRSDIRRIGKLNYGAELGKLEDLEYFYHELYLPMVHLRHGEKAHIVPFKTMLERWSRGHLVFITHNNKRIAGNFMLTHRLNRRMIRHQWMGVSAEMLSSAQNLHETNLALYHNVIRNMHGLGYTKSNLGMSPPLLGPASLLGKTHWGAEITLPASPLLYEMDFHSRSHLHRWLERSPVIHLVRGLFYASALWPKDKTTTLPDRIEKEIVSKVYFKNLAGVLLHDTPKTILDKIGTSAMTTMSVKGRSLNVYYCL